MNAFNCRCNSAIDEKPWKMEIYRLLSFLSRFIYHKVAVNKNGFDANSKLDLRFLIVDDVLSGVL